MVNICRTYVWCVYPSVAAPLFFVEFERIAHSNPPFPPPPPPPLSSPPPPPPLRRFIHVLRAFFLSFLVVFVGLFSLALGCHRDATMWLVRDAWRGDARCVMMLGPSGKYDEIGSKSGHGAGGDREGMDANIAMLEKEHEEITKVLATSYI